MRPYNNLENNTPTDTEEFHHFRTTTGIQSGPDDFDESRFIILGVT